MATNRSELTAELLKAGEDDPIEVTRVKLQLARQELELLNVARKQGVINESRVGVAQEAVARLQKELKAKEPQ
jgi:uncharacterized small protein (DUF1192 family)